ncbi:MAG: isocitrate/isopropylmalate dehydrogenase family protein [Candidatus Omnitrophica bacterium]|nr:isocitrate/isopropylmalate dehydrogenase family protein [Candidatus Omnitrophota bacterium]
MRKITFISGDGIGPEISELAKRCIEATDVRIEWEEAFAGEEALKRFNTPLPEATLQSIKRNKIAIKGPVTTPVGKGFRSVNVQMRQELGLYACLRPCKSFSGVNSRYEDIDLTIIRENSEDLYAGIEFKEGSREGKEIIEHIQQLKGVSVSLDSAISIKPISRYASKRIFRFAFEYAKKNGRDKITAVHKANIMKYSDGLFLESGREISKQYPDIEFEDKIVDNMCMQLVLRPQKYGVLVLPNLYGDIISDLCAGLIGGLGISPGANIGDNIALFEPTHGSAPKYKDKNKVNPAAMILSAVLMLRYLKEDTAADRIEKAVKNVIKEGKVVTYDLGGTAGTSEMGEEIIRKVASSKNKMTN